MTEYNSDELMQQIEHMTGVIQSQNNVIAHLRSVIDLYIKDEQRVEQLIDEGLIQRLTELAEATRTTDTKLIIADLVQEAATTLSHIKQIYSSDVAVTSKDFNEHK